MSKDKNKDQIAGQADAGAVAPDISITQPKPEAVALEYLGGGFLPGVPARSLTLEEAKAAASKLWIALTPEQIKEHQDAGVMNGEELLASCGLYRALGAKQKTPAGKES